MKKFILFIAALSIYFSLYAQKTITKDFNSDGYLDTLILYSESGSMITTRDIEIKGSNSLNVEMQATFAHSTFVNFMFLDSLLTQIVDNQHLDEVKQNIFSAKKKDIDPSLDYLLSIHNLYSNKFNTLDYHYKPVWFSTWIKLENYFIDINNTEIGLLNRDDLVNNQNSKNISVLYSGFNHQRSEPEKITCSGDIELMVTAHGVAIYENEKYSWCFISDNRINPAIEKLRNPTIDKVWCFSEKKLIIISQKVALTNDRFIFLVNYQNGTVNCVFKTDNQAVDNVKIRKEKLCIFSDDSKKEIFSMKLASIP